jgi:hypothetical protein
MLRIKAGRRTAKKITIFMFKGSTTPKLANNLMLPTSPSKTYDNCNVASSEKNPGKLRTELSATWKWGGNTWHKTKDFL